MGSRLHRVWGAKYQEGYGGYQVAVARRLEWVNH